jgi:hypothetical protein
MKTLKVLSRGGRKKTRGDTYLAGANDSGLSSFPVNGQEKNYRVDGCVPVAILYYLT